ncbi:Superoxide dismutase Cu-Zn [Hondaea fermentalgiana]|uniref:superoxide dismutase n=1 Tax=Hondaea fermentalgiana TaxID=2315210 RepID=A0A2R5GCR7_9STRA|nr:Superoxide dismutase Cu-Zn [Hondaea fermentalgiana]|eukprot:GBG28355.1 Superoxide dismutase Cu-Zn [Hondaea fermentalgiana]
MAKCSVKLSSVDGAIQGVLKLEQASEAAPTTIQGEITGLAPGKHGVAVLVSGDLSNAPTSLGEHFNPHGKNHGGPDADERHVGSLGNVEADADGKATVSISDKLVKLIGPQSIIGRAIAVMSQEDDLGLGGQEQSLINGNAGPAIAFGVVGIQC